MNDMKENIRKAIRCCRDERCDKCPVQMEICDELCVEMVEVPEQLLDMIDETLSEDMVQ